VPRSFDIIRNRLTGAGLPDFPIPTSSATTTSRGADRIRRQIGSPRLGAPGLALGRGHPASKTQPSASLPVSRPAVPSPPSRGPMTRHSCGRRRSLSLTSQGSVSKRQASSHHHRTPGL